MSLSVLRIVDNRFLAIVYDTIQPVEKPSTIDNYELVGLITRASAKRIEAAMMNLIMRELQINERFQYKFWSSKWAHVELSVRSVEDKLK